MHPVLREAAQAPLARRRFFGAAIAAPPQVRRLSSVFAFFPGRLRREGGPSE
jgi:hypothetical protein